MKISRLIIGLLCLYILFYIGRLIPLFPYKIVFGLLFGFIVLTATLMDLRIGLFILIFVVPFTQQLKIGGVGKVPIDVGTDDFLIICIIFSWLVNSVRRKVPLFPKTSLNWPIVAFFTAAVFSFIGSGIRFGLFATLIGFLHLFKFFEYVLIYFIVVSVIDNLSQVKKYILMFFKVTGIIVVIQITAILVWGTSSFSDPSFGGRNNLLYFQSMYSFVSNAILGAYYCFFLSILLAVLLDTPVSKGKVPLTFFSIILSFCLFNSFSRSAYLGLFMVFLILSILKERRLFLVVLLLLVFSPIILQSAILERITVTIQAVKPTLVFDDSAAARLDIWQRGIRVFLNSPIFGVGYWTTRWALSSEAHSQYLAILIETGIVGFSVFCWLIIRMYKNAFALMKNGDTYFLRSLGLGYIAGLSGLLTTCIFSETFEAFRITGPLWFVTALIVSANRILSEKTEKLNVDST